MPAPILFPLVGGSIVNADEDISPYATFHLLGMREENKNSAPNAAQNFQTLPPGQGGPMMPPPGPQTGPNTPAHHAHPMSQTMNVSKKIHSSIQVNISYNYLY